MLRLHGIRLAVLVAISLASEISAQKFVVERHRLLPVERRGPFAAAGDLDGDGDLDLATSWSWLWPYASGLLLGNDGQGRFQSLGASPPAAVAPIALGDIDGDGDVDIAIGGAYLFAPVPVRLIRNDGALGFTEVGSQWPATDEWPSRILLVDYDGDMDLDLVTCNRASMSGWAYPFAKNRLYLNNGSGFFTDVTGQRMPIGASQSRNIAAGDLDADGDLDLVFCGGTVSVFLQNVQGVVQPTPAFASTPIGAFTDVALVDSDLDGDLDLATASLQGGLQLYANNGAGFFTPTASIADGDIQTLVPADVDGDGRVDLVAVRRNLQTGQPLPLRLLANTPGGFVDVTAARVEGADLAPSAALVFDCDGDGDLDLWGDLAPQPVLWHNDGQGNLLLLAARDLSQRRIKYAALADADGDSDLDLACIETAAYGDTQVFVCANTGDGPGMGVDVVLPWNTLQGSRCVTFVDRDQDGDLDLFVGNEGGSTTGSARDLLFDNQAGTFVDVTQTRMPLAGGASSVATGDVDGDGRTDLVTAGGVGNLYLADGTGGFVLGNAMLPSPPVAVSGVALLDFDLDGDLDLAQSLAGPTSTPAIGFRLLRNDGPAPFVDVTSAVGLATLQAWAVATIDIDRDGRLDLLVADHTAGANGLRLFRSVGAGFVDETAVRVPPITAVGRITVLDLDGNGWDDVACDDGSTRELRNVDGVLVAAPFGAFSVGIALPDHPAAADFDHDGDQDVVQSFGAAKNRTRQLQNAVPPRLGFAAELVVHAYGGNGVDLQAALLLLSPQTAPAPIATSFGTLFLDPAVASYHSTHLINGTGGEATIPYTVPSSPSVLGSAVFAQAAFVHTPDPATWRLGNVLELRVRL